MAHGEPRMAGTYTNADGTSWVPDQRMTISGSPLPEDTTEAVYRYVKHDYGFRRVRIDDVTGCQIEQDGNDRWAIYLLRNGTQRLYQGAGDNHEIAGFFPTLDAAQRVMERIWAALELDALVIE